MSPTLMESLKSRLVEHDGHWLWTGWTNDKGYPYVRHEGRDQPAYRVVWSLLRGAIPEGLELDHLCVTPRCCNPEHLEPVTHAENQRRIRERYTQCTYGHDWTDPNNVRTRTDGSRYCAECDRISQRAKYVPTGVPQHAVKTHCKQGHPLSGENLHITKYPDGRFRQRRCRTCIRQSNQKRASK